jgi:hypothetical protein
MPLNRSWNTPRAARARPTGPHCRGGASSLLRLTQPGDRRLPTAVELGGWMSRAADVLMPVTGPHHIALGTEFTTHGGTAR